MLVCMDRSQIISSVADSQQKCLSPPNSREGRSPRGWKSCSGQPRLPSHLWCGCDVAVRARTRQQCCPQPWHREMSIITEGQVAQACGCPCWPLDNIIFAGATGGGRAESPPGPPPSQGSDWWAWQPLNKYFWYREFTCQRGGAPRGNFQSRSVGDNDTAQGSPP